MVGRLQESRCKAVFVELKNLVLTSSWKGISLPANTFKSIVCSAATAEHQCGLTTEQEYYARLALDFGQPAEEMEASFNAIRDSLSPNQAVMNSLAAVKARYDGRLKLYALTNLSREDFAAAKRLGIDWSCFDRIFVSSEIGMRKPELRFYNAILDQLHLRAEDAVLIDDDTDNLLAAMSLGMEGLLYPDVSVNQAIVNLLEGDSIGRALSFLKRNSKNFNSITQTGITIRENFAQLLILEVTGDESLVEIDPHETTWNYFIGPPVISPTYSPDDFDTTSLATTVLDRPSHIAHQVMDIVLKYRTPDGLVQSFMTDLKNRVDPVVCCNVLSVFYKYGRGTELAETLEWVVQVLQRRAYINGTSYYPMPESFLYFFSRFLSYLKPHNSVLYGKLRVVLAERLRERLGVPVDVASLAMRLIAGDEVGVFDRRGLVELRKAQNEDGGWAFGTLYRFASKQLSVGNRGVSTAFAIEAIRRSQRWDD
ncbi:uncharacterized protein N7511_001543 [Penicillium nucicola]|uniref:uncharacterized protein n=1 Tax=Penicillium nucicola TaxID=1850975 RepID=UPI0025459585|nr:uncharacterized protein N7511_001543 [Penicillium nucicola]KAJ5776532.1 hypothetical protein N7511_001543 [Penicillium nucicola]